MIKIKNKDVIKCFFLLRDVPLSLKESRLRSKFCKILAQHNDCEYIPEKQKIINMFAVIDENGQQVISNNKLQEYQTENKLLDDEELLIECNEINKMMVLCINDVLNNEEVFEKISGEDALIHDMLCDIFEEAVKKYDN